jgi:hypothetical protein
MAGYLYRRRAGRLLQDLGPEAMARQTRGFRQLLGPSSILCRA